MINGQPSATAYRVAIRRAAHQLLDKPCVFEDPLAIKIVGCDREPESKDAQEEGPMGRYLRAFIAVRSRYAEDQLAETYRQGVRQYVVLGAGLDTFAYRNPFSDLRVFEIDHPATQAWKRQLLSAGGISLPQSLTFVPVNFEQQSLAQGLENSGFNAGNPAFFSWLGVTPYLSCETVLETLRWVISICPRNGIVFDYTVPRASLSPEFQAAFDLLASRVAAAGEPFVGFFDPRELRQSLEKMGFAHIENLDATEINARYFNNRNDGFGVRGGRLMCARG